MFWMRENAAAAERDRERDSILRSGRTIITDYNTCGTESPCRKHSENPTNTDTSVRKKEKIKRKSFFGNESDFEEVSLLAFSKEQEEKKKVSFNAEVTVHPVPNINAPPNSQAQGGARRKIFDPKKMSERFFAMHETTSFTFEKLGNRFKPRAPENGGSSSNQNEAANQSSLEKREPALGPWEET